MTRRWASLLLLALLAAACSSGSDAKGPTATVGSPKTTESTTTTTKLTPEQEVEAAYLKSWDVYIRAKREVTSEGLDCCYFGDQLARTRADIEDRIKRNAPARVSVEHNYRIRMIAADVAVVEDTYRNHSVLIDPDTGEPIEADPNNTSSEIYTLRRIEGVWKVADISIASPSS